MLCYSYNITASPTYAPDFTITDTKGKHHKLYDYLNEGKSVILNFSSTWCRPCWQYNESGVLTDVYSDYGPNGSNEVVVIFIEADKNTCEDCLFGQEKCNDFSYGNWTGNEYPSVNLDYTNENLTEVFQVKRFPSIYAISSKDFSVSQVGQLDAKKWERWIENQQKPSFSSIRFAPLNMDNLSYNSSIPNKEIDVPVSLANSSEPKLLIASRETKLSFNETEAPIQTKNEIFISVINADSGNLVLHYNSDIKMPLTFDYRERLAMPPIIANPVLLLKDVSLNVFIHPQKKIYKEQNHQSDLVEECLDERIYDHLLINHNLINVIGNIVDRPEVLLDVYPNPCAETLNISVRGFKNPVKIKLVSSEGNLTLHTDLSKGSNKIDLSYYTAGTYNLYLDAGDQVFEEKLLIIK